MATLPPSVQSAKAAATQAAKTAGAYGAAEPTITDVLRQKITEAYSSNQDIVEPLDVATQGFLQAPQQGRERYEDIFNPFQREALVSQYQGNKALPMLSLSNIYGNRVGRIEDTLGAGLRGFQSLLLGQQSNAQLQRQLYSDALTEYQLTQPNYSTVDLGDRIAIMDESGNIVQTYPKGAVPKSGGGDGGGIDLAGLLNPFGAEWEDVTGTLQQPWQEAATASVEEAEPQYASPGGIINTLSTLGSAYALPGKAKEAVGGIKSGAQSIYNVGSGLYNLLF